MKSGMKRAVAFLLTIPPLILITSLMTYNRSSIYYNMQMPICDELAKVVILVTSNAPNIGLRQAQRSAFSAQVLWSELRAVRIFLVAQHRNVSVMEQVMQEQDVLLGDFNESYRNLALKHMMGLSWAADNCHQDSIVIKMDDDIAVDLISVAHKAMQDVQLHYSIAGWTHRGMKVRRNASKWAVTKEEYAFDEFPDFVSGWVYATNLRTIQKLVSHAILDSNPLWIDDAWLTGIVRQKAKTINLVGWDQFYSPYTEHLQCCINDDDRWCDFLAMPSGSNEAFIEAYGQQALNCHMEQSCSRRKWSESVWNNCQVDNPLFLPESKGVGKVFT